MILQTLYHVFSDVISYDVTFCHFEFFFNVKMIRAKTQVNMRSLVTKCAKYAKLA